jgi:endo-1,4-beta-xylanase
MQYVDVAFEAARQTDPEALLIYNDWDSHTFAGSTYTASKTIADRLGPRGLLDGFGVQLYVDATSPPRKDQIVAAFRSFGLPVYVTEFAVNLRHATGSQQQRFDLQARIYEDVTAAVLASGVCKGFFDFQVGDRFSPMENITTLPFYSREADPTPF